MQIDFAEIFREESTEPRPMVRFLDLEEGRGICAMARVPDGFLIISGNVGQPVKQTYKN